MAIRLGGPLAVVGFLNHLDYIRAVAYLPEDSMAHIDEIPVRLDV